MAAGGDADRRHCCIRRSLWALSAISLRTRNTPRADCYCTKPDGDGYTTEQLSDLLPQAFGPQDLAVKAGLISSQGNLPKLNLKTFFDDPLVHRALSAAERTYAPYTHNSAGCTIQVSDQKIYTGSYVETAAFNPSLSPLHTAIIRMNMDGLATDGNITRAILVEKPTTISQRGVSELLLDSLAPDIRLEYYEIR